MRAEETGMDHPRQELAKACEQLHKTIQKAYWDVSSDEVKKAIDDCCEVVLDLWTSLSTPDSAASQGIEESTKSAHPKLAKFLSDKRMRNAGLDADIRKMLEVMTKVVPSLNQNSHGKPE